MAGTSRSNWPRWRCRGNCSEKPSASSMGCDRPLCASRAISLVAEGATDAHVDARGRLTAESYLAAARLVIEAGGWVVGLDGTTLTVPESLTDRVSLVAASSRELCDEIEEVLGAERH